MPALLPVIDTTAALCCAPLGSADFEPERDAAEVAARMRALGDANRVRIVQELSCCADHVLTTTQAAELLGVTDATANHHLKQLAKAGLLTSDRDGARVLYKLNMEATRAVARTLNVTCGATCACR